VPRQPFQSVPLPSLVDFLNSRDERFFGPHGVRAESDRDVFSEPAALKRWLVKHGLAGSRVEVSKTDLAKARRFRDIVREAVEGESAVRHAVVEEFIANFRLQVQFGGAAPVLVPASQGVDGVLGALLAAIVLAEAKGQWHRVKMCAANDCRWVFYDGSKNCLGRWCSMDACGNRVKTRRYRKKRRRAARK
jgi:predicted RNA-binding Zn ribbon-like protein